MATLGEIKTSIADEINRDDLTTQIAARITRAIDFYADTRFWFNEEIKTITTTADDEYVAVPTGLRREDEDGVFITVGGFKYPLAKKDRTYIQYWQSSQNLKGQPVEYAYESEQWRLFPTPSQAYTITVLGIYDIDAPASDSASNDWTNYAEDLIVSRAKLLIARDILYDDDMARTAFVAEKEALTSLKSETSERTSLGQVEPGW